MNIPDGLRRFREKHTYTQESLADRLGCSRRSIARWEAGDKEPQAIYLLEICSIDRDFPSLCATSVTIPPGLLS